MKIAFVFSLLAGIVLAVGCGSSDTTTVTQTTTAAASSTSSTTSTPDTNQPIDPEQTGSDGGGLKLCSDLKAPDEGTCIDGKYKYDVVNRNSTLKLEELDVDLVSIDTTDVLADVGVERPNGVFLVITLAVTNRLSAPVYFDDTQDQTTYGATVNGDYNQYTEDFDAENGGDEQSFLWQGKEIQPDTTQTGTIIFDVPQEAVDNLDKDGNINILNFSDAESYGGRAKLPIGVIRTYVE